MDRYWALQGPSRFVDRILADLRAGASVALFRPPHWPDGCRHEIAARVRANDLWTWAVVDAGAAADPEDGDPACELARKFVVHSVDNASPLQTLVGASVCEGLVVWVTGLTERTWQTWRHFLDDYDQIVRNRETYRMQFVFDVPAHLHRVTATGAATLRSHAWRGSADPYDMQVMTWNLLRDVSMTHLHRRLAVATICECAGNDEYLLRRLVDRWESPLIDPVPVLLEEAQRRGWDAASVAAPDWRLGTLEHWNGVDRIHSCAVALREDAAELRRRQWTAHVSVVFPFLEQERAKLIAEMASTLRLPHTTKFGVIEDARDLELSHLLRQAEASHSTRSTVQWLECLVALRHRLAHLEPLEARQLDHPELLRRLGSGQRQV